MQLRKQDAGACTGVDKRSRARGDATRVFCVHRLLGDCPSAGLLVTIRRSDGHAIYSRHRVRDARVTHVAVSSIETKHARCADAYIESSASRMQAVLSNRGISL